MELKKLLFGLIAAQVVITATYLLLSARTVANDASNRLIPTP